MRAFFGFLVAPLTIAVFDFLIAIPMGLALFDIVSDLGSGHHSHEAAEIVIGIGVIMIGWGVALEERKAFRDVFKVPDDPGHVQEHIDHSCHYYGLGQLVLGLFAEICVEAIKLPDRIINTSRIEPLVLGLSLLLIGLGLLFLFKHMVHMVIYAVGGTAARKAHSAAP